MSGSDDKPEFIPFDPAAGGEQVEQCPLPEEEEGAEIIGLDVVPTVQEPDFCARVEAVGDMLDTLGQSLRDQGENINTADVASMIESIIQTGVGVSTGSAISGRIKARLDDAMPRLDFGTVLESWTRAVGTFCPTMGGRLLNQLAARYVLQCLADFTVAWGASESKSSGQGSSLGISIGGGV